jgi:LysM repeat protein
MKNFAIAFAIAVLMAVPFFSPAAAAAPSNVLAVNCGEAYRVQPGDTLASIANKCNLTVTFILEHNPLISDPPGVGTIVQLTGPVQQYTGPVQTSSGQIIGSCGATYIVQYGDWLATIARRCGTTVAAILARNPQIVNANVIYAGMVLSMSGTATGIVYGNGGYWLNGVWYNYGTGGPVTTYVPPTTTSTYAWVSVSSTRARAGDSVTVYVHGFPANGYIDYRVGQMGSSSSVVYDGRVDAYGNASATITIPSSASAGETWIVHVITTEGTNGVQAYTGGIYITN